MRRFSLMVSLFLLPVAVFAGNKPKDLFKAELVKLYGADEKGKLPKADMGYCSSSPAVSVVLKQGGVQAEHPRQYNRPMNVYSGGVLAPATLQFITTGGGPFDSFPFQNLAAETAVCVTDIKVSDDAVYVEFFTKASLTLSVAGTTQQVPYKAMVKFPVGAALDTIKADEFKKNTIDHLLVPVPQQFAVR